MGELIKTGVANHRTITVFDLADAPKTGLVGADFTTKTVTKNGTVSALAITITEINAVTRPGQYDVAFTPDTNAEYYNRIAHPTYNVRGFTFEFTSTTDGPLTLALIAGAVPTAVQNRTEMDSNSADLNTLIAGSGSGNSYENFDATRRTQLGVRQVTALKDSPGGIFAANDTLYAQKKFAIWIQKNGDPNQARRFDFDGGLFDQYFVNV